MGAAGEVRVWPAVLFLLYFWTGSNAPGQEQEAGAASELSRLKSEYGESVQPFFKRYCYRCHGARRMESGVRLDALDLNLGDKELFLLQHVHKQLQEDMKASGKRRSSRGRSVFGAIGRRRPSRSI